MIRGLQLSLLVGSIACCSANSLVKRSPRAAPPPAAPATLGAVTRNLSAWHYPTPPCRRADGLSEVVKTAAERILNTLQRPRLPVVWINGQITSKRVAVNDGGLAGDVLHVELVRDAATDAIDAKGCPLITTLSPTTSDRDERSVPALCQAIPVEGIDVIRCSADGLAALVDADIRRGRSSPALTYVLAHELSHLAHGDARSFLPVAKVIDLALPADSKWEIAAEGCDQRSRRDAAVLSLETRADADALKVLEDIALQDADASQDPAVSISLTSMDIWTSTETVKRWSRRWQHSAELPAAIVDAPLAPDAAYIAWSADRVLCDLLTIGEGYVLVPTFNGDHPSEPTRLASISVELARVAPRFHGSSGPLPEQVEELAARLGGANAVVDEQQRTYFEAFGAELCKHTNRGVRPVCEQVSAHGPTPRPTCPEFNAPLSERTLQLAPAHLAAEGKLDGILKVQGAVRAALRMSEGRMLIATASNNVAALLTSKGMNAWTLPCTPVTALEDGPRVSILCEDPLAVLSMDDSGHAYMRSAASAVYDDEPVSMDDLRGGWFGNVNGTLHATIHLALSGKATTVRFDDDAIRTAKPWLNGGCERLFAGMSAVQFDANGDYFGATWLSKATSLATRFDPHFDHVVALAHPTDEPPTIACGPANVFKSTACIDDHGALFNPFSAKNRRPLAQLALSSFFKKAARISGRVCSTRRETYVQVTGTDGSTGATEVFKIERAGTEASKVYSLSSAIPELNCGTTGATVIAPMSDGTTIISPI